MTTRLLTHVQALSERYIEAFGSSSVLWFAALFVGALAVSLIVWLVEMLRDVAAEERREAGLRAAATGRPQAPGLSRDRKQVS